MPLTRATAIVIVVAALFGLCSVLLGAWAAHGLAEPAKDWVATAAQVHLGHAAAMLATALLIERSSGWTRRLALGAAAGFALGMALFGGGLVALAVGVRLGGFAPLGGFALMAGWLALALAGALGLRRR